MEVAGSPVDFSNASYEAFESLLLKAGVGVETLAWQLRDMAFSALFHDPIDWSRIRRGRGALFAFPGGWIAWLYSHHVESRLRSQPVRPVYADHHFLCLSNRSNHIQRIGPEMKALAGRGRSHVWCVQEEAMELLAPFGPASSGLMAGGWATFLDTGCISTARAETDRIVRALGGVDRLAKSKLAVTFAIHQAALHFWRHAIGGPTSFCLTTYEKDPVAKAFLTVAREKGVARRVHWTHGLRHASQRATLANELWCLTAADARYFGPRVPGDCTAIHRPSPESLHWLKILGKLPEAVTNNPERVHFLVLGSGFDPGYTDEMSRADLGVIAKARAELGDRVRWRFRPHPGNIPRFRADLDAVGLNDIDFSTRSLEEDLCWSHAVASTFSSVAIDVEPTGRPIFWILAELRPLYSVDQMIREGYGIHLDPNTAASKIRDAFGLK